MSAWLFRFVCNGKPTDYCGIAIAKDMDQLFQEIDEYGDPYAAEIKPLKSGSISWKQYEDCEEVVEVDFAVGGKVYYGLNDVHGWKRAFVDPLKC